LKRFDREGRISTIEAEIGARIRAARTGREMTQADLAERIGLTRSSIANIEAGRQSPGAGLLVLVSEALDTSVAALCGQAVDRSLGVAISGLQRRLASVVDAVVDDLERANRELGRVTAIVSARPEPAP
jgi:transcriptional regulator with XRE-family HTH domain